MANRRSSTAEPNKLWAPWRKKFLRHTPVKGCIFCSKPKARGIRSDRRNFIVERGSSVFMMLNLYPYNNGHLMIAPYRHIDSPALLTEAEHLEMLRLMRVAIKKCDKILKPHGYNIGMNVGRTAGAGFDKHIHLHIVPRWLGDTNFMPVVTGDKVISESLEQLWERLID
jgi:ATP adenylyltransferase